jgi:polar amino acid transport system substrate-binding protein
MIRIFAVTAMLVALMWGHAMGAGRVVLASLEWPPYTGADLPGQGATAEVVRQAFRQAGYELEIRFYPWSRVLHEARLDSEVVGYFPEYPASLDHDLFLPSDTIGTSPLGLVTRREFVLRWSEPRDLARYRLGIVAGYFNTPEFDRLVERGVLTVDQSNSDALNLRKVLAGRTHAAVVDINVFERLREVDPVLRKGREQLAVHDRLLAVNELVVCFRASEAGARLRDEFNAGLARVERKDISQRRLGE